MNRLRALIPPLLVLAAAIALRAFVIEPSHIGHACDPAPWSGWCAARTALIMAFRFQEIGWAALAVGIVATFLRRSAGWASWPWRSVLPGWCFIPTSRP